MVAHARLYREDGRGHQPRKTGKRGPDPEQERIEQAYVHAQDGDHARIACPRSNEHSDPRVMDDEIQPERDDEPDKDDEEAIGWISSAKNLDGAVKAVGGTHVQRLRAPDDADGLVEEKDQAECGKDLIEMIASIEGEQRCSLDDQADQHGAEHRRRTRDQERSGFRKHRRAQVGPQHVERTVRQVHKIHDAKDKRQPGRQQEQQKAVLQAVERLRQQKIPGHGVDRR